MTATLTLDAEIVSWIEAVTGLPVTAASRIPGGGTRQGWLIDLREPDGAILERFLRYSPRPETSAFHPLSVEAEVVRALGAAGSRVAGVHAAHPEREAVLLDRVPGDTWFYRIKDPAEQVAVAQDFIRCLAYTHRIDPKELSVPSLGPARSAREHALERLTAIRERGTRADGTLEPLLRLSLDWLERNVPDYDGPVVLVQGDTGPGNFLYRDGRVTAVLDWELSHWGDPMDDIAWLSLRAVQDTFTYLPDRLAEYERLSGHAIDHARVWYYRVFAEATMATLRPPQLPPGGTTPRTPRGPDDGKASVSPGQPGEALKIAADQDVGNKLLYRQLHRRLWLEALDAVLGLGLQRPAPPAASEAPEWHPLYGDALRMLRTITPRITDPLASQWTKGVARILRYLEAADADGRACEEAELDELGQALGRRPLSVMAARGALEEANRGGAVSDEQYVRHLWNQVMRDDYLMRAASGALATRTWPPLAG